MHAINKIITEKYEKKS